MSNQRQRILTGLRANNDLTIGNYLGALLPMIDMAHRSLGENYQFNLFVPDLHSFTTPIDHTKLQEQIMQNLRVFVAAGFPINDPNVYIYRQSYIPAHSELTWILDCFTGYGEMSRMTQFKDKSAKLSADRISIGLFNYPVLMAADILLYNANYVPVGDDQTQHLEFTRDIAMRLNNQFGDIFVVPEAVSKQHEFFGKDQGLRIKDLIDPTKKMSKSDDTGRGVIFMNDSPEVVRKKVMGATTDSYGEIRYDPKERPGISNLLQILALMRQEDLQTVVAAWEGQTQYGELKEAVATELTDFIGTFQKRIARIDDTVIVKKLQTSEAAMNHIANATLLRVQQAVGLRPNHG